MIAAETRVPVAIEDVAQEGPTRMCADWSRAKRVLGWEPQVTLQDGLRELIELSRREAA